MSPKIIAAIYFYLVSAGSLILIVVGVFLIVNFIVNSTQFKEYPLPYYDSCDISMRSISPDDQAEASASVEEKQRCEKNLEHRRTQQRVDDLKGAITFTLVGLILFGIHFPLARRQTK